MGSLSKNDIEDVDKLIKQILNNLEILNTSKREARGIIDYYELSKRIRENQKLLILAFKKYIELERKFGFPVNFAYRQYYKKLNGSKK